MTLASAHQSSLQRDGMGGDKGHGRAITPEDLHALRGFYEACAFVSAEAALLAVLVDGIGTLGRLVVHPAELIEDLGKRLHSRDAPTRLTPQLIGGWLRRLGFVPIGRDGRGRKYEIPWAELWEMDPRVLTAASGLDLFVLNGPQLLRLLAEGPDSFFAPHIWCRRCQRVTAILRGDWTERLGESFRCSACDGPATLLEEGWRKSAFERIRRAIRKDPDLLSRVKMKWDELHDGAPFPRLPEPFGWFNRVWEKAGRPPGRPSSVLVRYELAHRVGHFESAGVSSEQIQELFLERDKEKRLEIYDNLPDRVHRFLGKEFRNSISTIPIVSRPEQLWRRVQWARRQWTSPNARLQEERVNAPIAKPQLGEESVTAPSLGSPSSSRLKFVHESGISGKYRPR